MIEILVLLAFVVGLGGGYHFISRRHQSKFLATAEYWVFLPTTDMPAQELVMDRMMNENPYRIRGRSPIGKNEGLVFSDIRLHIALVLRSKNPHVFRRDLFTEAEVPDSSCLALLDGMKSFVKLRYMSEEPLSDKRHLRFLAHAAVAYATIGNGVLIYDATAEKLQSAEGFAEDIQKDPDLYNNAPALLAAGQTGFVGFNSFVVDTFKRLNETEMIDYRATLAALQPLEIQQLTNGSSA